MKQASQNHPALTGAANVDGALTITVRGVRERFGWGRSTTYQLLAEGKLVGVKLGRRLLIFTDSCNAVVAALPKATFTPPKSGPKKRVGVAPSNSAK